VAGCPKNAANYFERFPDKIIETILVLADFFEVFCFGKN